MYILYKNEKPISVCYTKLGAYKSRRHFIGQYALENPNVLCRVTVEPVNHYNTLRLGLMMLQVIRIFEKRKLSKLTHKETTARYLREHQEDKVASLY